MVAMSREAAKSLINFEVEKRSMYVNDQRVEKKVAIFRPDINKIVGVTSPKYVLINHSEILAPAIDVLEKDYNINKVSMHNFGEKVVVDLISKEMISIKGDKFNHRLMLINSYNGSKPFEVIVGFFRHLCSNGAGYFVPGLDGILQGIRHYGSRIKENLSEIPSKIIELVKGKDFHIENYKKDIETISDYSLVPMIKAGKLNNFISDLGFGKKDIFVNDIVDRIYNPVNRKEESETNFQPSMYELYNAYTHRWTHGNFKSRSAANKLIKGTNASAELLVKLRNFCKTGSLN